jgi:hypothetical protein
MVCCCFHCSHKIVRNCHIHWLLMIIDLCILHYYLDDCDENMINVTMYHEYLKLFLASLIFRLRTDYHLSESVSLSDSSLFSQPCVMSILSFNLCRRLKLTMPPSSLILPV